MAEGEEGTPKPEGTDPPPAKPDNEGKKPEGEGPEPGKEGTPEPSEPPKAAEKPIHERLGFQNEQDLERTVTRYREQIRGSQTEVQRLREELAGAKAGSQKEDDILGRLRDALGGGKAEQPLSLKDAFDAYLNGDEDAVRRYEERIGKAADPDEIQRMVNEQLSGVTKPAVYLDNLGRRHPELNDPESDVFKRVLQDYDRYAEDPWFSTKYAKDPAAVREIRDPDTGVPRKFDLRIVDDVASQVKADIAKEQGRKEELERQGRPAVGGQATHQPPADDVDPWNFFSESEKAEMQNIEATKSAPDNWPKTAKAIAKHRFEKLMSEAERDRRKREFLARRAA